MPSTTLGMQARLGRIGHQLPQHIEAGAN